MLQHKVMTRELCNSEQKLVIKLKSSPYLQGLYRRDNFVALQVQLCPAVILVQKWLNSYLFTYFGPQPRWTCRQYWCGPIGQHSRNGPISHRCFSI